MLHFRGALYKAFYEVVCIHMYMRLFSHYDKITLNRFTCKINIEHNMYQLTLKHDVCSVHFLANYLKMCIAKTLQRQNFCDD